VPSHDENGKFAKGNPGGPGRPRKEREERFYEIAISAVSFADWREVIQKAVSQAKRGDTAARKFLADYLMGTPINRTEILGKDGSPQEFGVVPVDYRLAITALAPRPVEYCDTPGEGESPLDGEALGQDGLGR
jgi:hypothetical protein